MNRRLSAILGIVAVMSLTITTVAWGTLDWSPPVIIGGTQIWDQYPEAAADDSGNVFVAWTTKFNPRLIFNEFDGADWGTPRNISHQSCCSWNADLSVGPSGDVHVVWHANPPVEVAYRRYDGNSWSLPTFTGLVPYDAKSVVEDNTGRIFVATGATSQGMFYVHGDGTTWMQPEYVAGAHGAPDLSMDADGDIYLAYAQAGIPRYRTWLGTAWSEETLLPGECVPHAYPSEITVEMYHSASGTSDLICMGGTIRHWHKTDQGWSEPVEVASPAPGFSMWSDAAGELSGALGAIWVEEVPPGSTVGDVFVRFWTGEKWLPAENVSNTSSRSIWPTIAISSDDKAVAIWSEGYSGSYYFWLNASVSQLEFPIPVDIDLKPGSYPNCVNVNGKGTIPVAVLGSPDFGVSQIDATTLSFAGLEVRLKGNGTPQCSIEDVSGDFTNPQGAPDGLDDLVCHFVDDEEAWSMDNGTATLTGRLFDGTAIEGSDEVCIVP